MRCLFAVNVWGRQYIDEFVKLALPMQLAPGNLADMPDLARCEYVINTRRSDVEYILAQPALHALQEMMPVDVRPHAALEGDKYNLLGKLQSDSFSYAREAGFDMVFPLYSDMLCAAGTFTNAARWIEDGKLAVMAIGPEAITESVTEALMADSSRWSDDPALTVPPRQLATLVLRHMHPLHSPGFWKPDFTDIPSMMFWEVPGQGAIAHAFHLHPVVLAIQDERFSTSGFQGTLDEHFLPCIFDCADPLHIVTDSDEIFLCSIDTLETENPRVASTSPYPSVAKVARWAERHAALLHRDFVTHPIRLHTGDMDASSRQAREAEAREIIWRVLARLGTPDATLKRADAIAYSARLDHRRQLYKTVRRITLAHSTAALVLHIVARFAAAVLFHSRWLRRVMRPKSDSDIHSSQEFRHPPSKLALTAYYQSVWRKLTKSYYDQNLLKFGSAQIGMVVVRRLFWRGRNRV